MRFSLWIAACDGSREDKEAGDESHVRANGGHVSLVARYCPRCGGKSGHLVCPTREADEFRIDVPELYAKKMLELSIMTKRAEDAEADGDFHKREHSRMRVDVEIQVAENRKLRSDLARLTAALGLDTPYPLAEVLEQLTDAAEHLLGHHSCDTHGHEGIRDAMLSARRILGALKKEEKTDAE
jgi:hypothetical protein